MYPCTYYTSEIQIKGALKVIKKFRSIFKKLKLKISQKLNLALNLTTFV